MILIDMKMPKDCKDCNFYVPNPMEGILFCKALFNEMDVCIDDITGKRYVRCPLREYDRRTGKAGYQGRSEGRRDET